MSCGHGVFGDELSRICNSLGGGSRRLGELGYESKEPPVLDGSNFVGANPSAQFTPRDEVTRQTCDWFGQRLSLGR